jgi:hypothetical protein
MPRDKMVKISKGITKTATNGLRRSIEGCFCSPKPARLWRDQNRNVRRRRRCARYGSLQAFETVMKAVQTDFRCEARERTDESGNNESGNFVFNLR